MNNGDIAKQGPIVAACLQRLLPVIDSNNSRELNTFLTTVISNTPPIDHKYWGIVTAFAGYCRRSLVGRYPLNAEQKHELWQALIWSVRYAQEYRPDQFAARFDDLLQFFAEYRADQEFVVQTVPGLGLIIPYLDDAALKQLEPCLMGAHLRPDPLLQMIARRFRALPASVIDPLPHPQPATPESRSDTHQPGAEVGFAEPPPADDAVTDGRAPAQADWGDLEAGIAEHFGPIFDESATDSIDWDQVEAGIDAYFSEPAADDLAAQEQADLDALFSEPAAEDLAAQEQPAAAEEPAPPPGIPDATPQPSPAPAPPAQPQELNGAGSQDVPLHDGASPAAQWLIARRMTIQRQHQPEVVDYVFDDLALFLGNRYAHLSGLHAAIQTSLSTHAPFQYDMAEKPQSEIEGCIAFCQKLRPYGLLTQYQYDPQHKRITAVAHKGARGFEAFINDTWFERFVRQQIMRVLSDCGANVSYLIHPQLTLPTGADLTVGLFLVVNGQPVWVECATANDPQSIINQSAAREQLRISPEGAFCVILNLEPVMAAALSHFHSITVTNQALLLDKIRAVAGAGAV